MVGPRCLLPVVLAVACGPATAALLSVQGDARDPASERLLYREEHLLRRDGDAARERVVLYRCADGTAFARKRVDYRASATAPDFSLVDARGGYREGLRRDGGTIVVYHGDRSAPLRVGTRDAMLVADAGFDEWLRLQWDALSARPGTPIRFAVPSLGRALEFEVRRLAPGSIGDRPVRSFQLRLGGVLALVSPRMEVSYDAHTRHLRRYTGVTNIRGDGGAQVMARIDFARPPQPASDAQWQAALSEPLARCRVGA